MNRIQVIDEKDTKVCEGSVQVKVLDKTLNLSLLLKEEQLQPLFSGAAWAGTMVWDAAIELSSYLLSHTDLQGKRVLELGAGIGVPGMVACVAGAAQIVVTEQEELLPLLRQNIKQNFSSSEPIQAQTLSWGTAEAQALDFPEGFDLILSCDCIYEPLYGKSYLLLADTLNHLLVSKPTARAIVSVERRNQDGVDKFQTYVESNTALTIEMLDKQGCIELYQLEMKK